MTIPASDIVSVYPGVISAGGSPLALNGVILTQSTLLPGVTSFPSADAVGAYFGLTSTEYRLANVYFLGFDNSTIKPTTLYFAPYAAQATSAWVRSGSFAGQSIPSESGTLTLIVDGEQVTSSTISLSTATSWSAVAADIQSAFDNAVNVSWNPTLSAITIASTKTGTESSITYATGTLAEALKLTSSTGAVIYPNGKAPDTPASAMMSVVQATQNWVSFMTTWEPSLDDKLNFAIWTNNQNNRYMYVAWDTDSQAYTQGTTTAFAVQANAANYNGVVPVYNTPDLAAFVLGTAASIDYSRTNGRITFAFKTQSGFVPTVTDQVTADNLLANGYSFYGAYATANDEFSFFYNGQMTGEWDWADTFVNQVYLNSQLQLALVELLTNVKSIPYNAAGYALIRAAMLDPINQALNAGIIRTGVVLSNAQSAEIAMQVGADVSSELEQRGYYLQIIDPGAQVRGQRGTPVINFFYTDGGAVQKISLASIDVL